MECKCLDCGKEFLKGEEGDNEKFCLRCQYISCEMDEDQDFSEGE